MGWIYLILAGLFELGFSSFLKLSEGITKPYPTLTFIGFGALSVWCLSKAMNTIPLGTAYAVWTGLGATGAVIMGVAVFKESMNVIRALFLTCIICGAVGLRIVS